MFELAVAALVILALCAFGALISDYIIPSAIRFHRAGMARVRNEANR